MRVQLLRIDNLTAGVLLIAESHAKLWFLSLQQCTEHLSACNLVVVNVNCVKLNLTNEVYTGSKQQLDNANNNRSAKKWTRTKAFVCFHVKVKLTVITFPFKLFTCHFSTAVFCYRRRSFFSLYLDAITFLRFLHNTVSILWLCICAVILDWQLRQRHAFASSAHANKNDKNYRLAFEIYVQFICKISIYRT